MKLECCPVKLITSSTRAYLSAYSHYKKGFLPHGGGWVKESNKFMKMMEMIDGTLAEIEINEANKIRNSK